MKAQLLYMKKKVKSSVIKINRCFGFLLVGSPSPLTPAGSCRYDSSLGNSRFKFFTSQLLFEKAPNNVK